jgi:beta-N-acetylhexosaminidase
MSAVHGRNICTAVVEAPKAGVDLLLVAFAGEQFYSIFACASDAVAHNMLDAAMLRHDLRLEQNFRRRAGVRPQAK